MKRTLELYKQFINKEKIIILICVFFFLIVCIQYTYSQSVYSQGYIDDYKDAALEFFYYIQCTGINPFLFMIFMLLLPNLVSYDILNQQQNHTTYLIETRVNKKVYYKISYIQNFIFTFLCVLILEIVLLAVIHFFYGRIHFEQVIYPEHYHALTQTICKNMFLNLISFLVLTSLGYALLSSLLFSIQVFIVHKYIYRCFGVILGISLMVFPVLIMGYFPIQDLIILLQINPLIAIGIEYVRENPFGLSNLICYLITFSLYSFIAYLIYNVLLKWRKTYD